MKKRLMHIFIIGVIFLFVACKGNDQETNFIPTQPPEFSQDDELTGDADTTDDSEVDPDESNDAPDDTEDEPAYIGETTTKYVKLRSYGAILNVRSEPSTEGNNIIGFLVHTEPVEVISIEGDWAKILYLGEIRYVSADYLSDTVPPYVSPPTQTSPAN